MLSDTQKHRIDVFAVRVKASNHSLFPDEREVEVTFNGFQWINVSMTPDEARKLVNALETFATPKA
jgi:hypothetical protein